MAPIERAPGEDRGWAPCAAIAVGALVLAIAWALALDGSHAWERTTTEAVNGWPAELHALLWPIMQLGSLPVAIAVSLLAYVVLDHWQPAVASLAAVVTTWLVTGVIKDLVERDRPGTELDLVFRDGEAGGFGFVSGHTSVAFALAAALAPWLPRPWRGVAFGLATIVGLARLYFGAHYPLDVLGGAGLGLLIGTAASILVRFTHEESSPSVVL